MVFALEWMCGPILPPQGSQAALLEGAIQEAREWEQRERSVQCFFAGNRIGIRDW